MSLSSVLAPFKALFTNVAFVTALISAIGAAIVIAVPAFEPYRDMVVKGAIGVILLAAGGSAVATATKPTADAKVEAAKAQSAPTARIQGASLKPYTPPADFTDTELRAIAYKLGALPLGDISHDGLVLQILQATAPKVAT